MGITDIDTENEWKFVTDNKKFDPNNGLFPWQAGEPNNQLVNKKNDKNYENCATLHFGNLKLNDVPCESSYYGLCEILK